jgi:hypothetical protein
MVTGRLGHACAQATHGDNKAHGDSNMAAAAKATIGMPRMTLTSLGTDRDQTLIVSGVIGA